MLFAADQAVSGPPFRRFGVVWVDSSSCQQAPSNQEQVSKRDQREELGAVLGDAPVADFHVAELALHDPKWMLDLGPNHSDHSVDPFVEGMQLAAFRGLAHHAPGLPGL